MMTWLREHLFVVSILVVFVVMEVRKVLHARRLRKIDAQLGGFDFPKYEPRVSTSVRCACGMGASCERPEPIAAAGWVRSDGDGRWRCPTCLGKSTSDEASSGKDG